MIDAVRAWLAERVPEGEHLRSGIVTGMYRTAPKVTIMFFDAAGEPVVVAKVARGPAAEQALHAEHRALLVFGPGGRYGAFAPAPLAIGRIEGRLVLAERVLSGRPMTTSYYEPGHVSSRRRIAADFAIAGAWLDAFGRATAHSPTRLGLEEVAEHVTGPISRYRREIGWSLEEERLFSDAIATADELSGVRLASTGMHGDFWMGNLLLGEGAVRGVVDWELAREQAPPFRDIYKFPTSYAAYLDRSMGVRGHVPEHRLYREGARVAAAFTTWRNAAGFAYAFLSNGWFASLVRRWIEDRLATHGMTPALNAVFYPVFLAEQAITLDDPTIRAGYRALVRLLGSRRRASWLIPNVQPSASIRASEGAHWT